MLQLSPQHVQHGTYDEDQIVKDSDVEEAQDPLC
jgi:hypothetical protein